MALSPSCLVKVSKSLKRKLNEQVSHASGKQLIKLDRQV